MYKTLPHGVSILCYLLLNEAADLSLEFLSTSLCIASEGAKDDW